MLTDQPNERLRLVAAGFTQRVLGTRAWDAPTPVNGWVSRDVVRHLTEWLPAFLAGSAGIELARGPSVDVDPVEAWQVHACAVQALLDEPETAELPVTNPHVGTMTVTQAVDRLYTPDVFMHTWDLARATGQDDRLDADLCAELVARMEPIEEIMRSSGQYGPRVPVPDGADSQTRLLGFIGRDPNWRPAAPARG
jgi:uncharacterized protein (TIGR03086 family)